MQMHALHGARVDSRDEDGDDDRQRHKIYNIWTKVRLLWESKVRKKSDRPLEQGFKYPSDMRRTSPSSRNGDDLTLYTSYGDPTSGTIPKFQGHAETS